MNWKRSKKAVSIFAAIALVVGLFPTSALADDADAFDQSQAVDIVADEGAPDAGDALAVAGDAEVADVTTDMPADAQASAQEPEGAAPAPSEGDATEQGVVLTAQDGNVIDSITLTVTPPDAGSTTEDAPKVEAPSGAGYTVMSTGWLKDDGTELGNDEVITLEAGKTYQFYVDVKADSGKSFGDSGPTTAIVGGTFVKSLGTYNAPDGSESLTFVQASMQVTAKHGSYTDENGIRYSYDKLVGSVTDAEGRCGITSIFIPYEEGKSVDLVIPGSLEGLTVTALGTEESSLTVDGGNMVRSITVPASVEVITGAYFTDKQFPNLATATFAAGSNLTELPAELFANSPVTSVMLPTNLKTISEKAFYTCTKLSSIDVPASVRTIGEYAFTNCDSLATIKLREGLKTIGDAAFTTDNSSYAYHNMTYTSISIPNSVETIGTSAFATESLTSVQFGTSLTDSLLTTIGDGAFRSTSLETVAIPNSVETIGEGAFDCKFVEGVDGRGHGCSTLKEVQFGTSQDASQLKTLGKDAFAGSALTTVTLPNKLESLGYVSLEEGYDNDYEYRTYGAFSQSALLQTIVWPTAPGLNTIGGFDGCTALKDEVISSLPTWVTTIADGAFSGCELDNIEIPAGVTTIGAHAFSYNAPDSVTVSEDGGALTIGDSAFWHGNTSSEATITLPVRVASIGAKAFAGHDDTLKIYNPDIEVGATEDTWPITAGAGVTVYYPGNAGASFNSFKAAVEAADKDANSPTKFVAMEEPLPQTIQHSIEVTAPQGATMQLLVNGQEAKATITGQTLTAKADEGSQVAVVVSLEGYKDYEAAPADGWLNADWTATVTEGDMTALTDAGEITVVLYKEGKETQRDRVAALLGSTVAVFDANGKLVAQDIAPTSLTVHARDLKAGAYTVVAFQKNEYFSKISSLGDFAKLGVKDGSWATAQATVTAGKTTEVTLTVPDLQILSAGEILASAALTVPASKPVPGYTFYARIDYAMVDGHPADSIQLNIPAGIEVIGSYTTNSSYGKALAVNLVQADKQSGSLYVGLQVTDPGAYNISASVTSGVATAPLGSANINAPALQLLVPETELASPEFTATVYAAPNSTISFKIGDTPLDATVVTNKTGRATATLTIPEEEMFANMFSIYSVTATATDAAGNEVATVSRTVDYPSTHVKGATDVQVWEFSFKHAGQEVFLAQEGQANPDVYYTCVMGTHNAFFWSPTWPFRAVLDSDRELGPTCTLVLRMLDDSTHYAEMQLQPDETITLPSGAKRYTYTADVPIGDGRVDVDLRPSDIPCGFDLTPTLASEVYVNPVATPENRRDIQIAGDYRKLSHREEWTHVEEDAKKASGATTDADFYYEYAPEAYAFLLSQGVDLEQRNVLEIVFGEGYKHENWDEDGSVWNSLTPEEKKAVVDLEDAMDAFLKAWADLMGTDEPMNKYDSEDDYLNDANNITTGPKSNAPEPGQLQDQGWEVVGVDETAGGADEWYAVHFVPDDEPLGKATRGEDVKDYPVDNPGDFGSGTGTVEFVQVSGDSFNKGNRRVPNVDSIGLNKTKLEQAAAELGGKANMYEAVMKSKYGQKSIADIAAGASKLSKGGEVVAGLISMQENHNKMITLDNRLIGLTGDALDLAKDMMAEGILDTPCGAAMAKQALWTLLYGQSTLARRGFLTLDNVVTAELTAISVWDKEPVTSKALGFLDKYWGDIAEGVDSLIYDPLSNWTKGKYEEARDDVDEDCRKQAKTAYDANVIVDPSGWVYEAVNENRLEGVTATVYQLIDAANDVWEKWDASQYGQVNSQTTGEYGLFAWDVPMGTWKVVFEKAGYEATAAIVNGVLKDKAETDELVVLPPYKDVAVGLISTEAPTVTEATVDGDEIVVVFSKHMKTAAAPTMTIDGVEVASTWANAVEGTNSAGEKELLATSLRIPLPATAKAGDVLTVAAVGGQSYAGTPVDSADSSRQVTVPGRIDVAGADIAAIPDQTWTGSEITPQLSVTWKGKPLVQGTDYTVSYADNVEVGTASATITGINDYTGTNSAQFTIVAPAISYYYVQPETAPVYTLAQTEKTPLAFTFKRNYKDELTIDHFTAASVGKAGEQATQLVKDVDYTVVSGSAVVTLKADYLEKLAAGDYELTAAFDDGDAVTATFAVKAAPAEEKSDKSAKDKASSPKTGDTLPVTALSLMALVSAAVLIVARRQTTTVGKHARR